LPIWTSPSATAANWDAIFEGLNFIDRIFIPPVPVNLCGFHQIYYMTNSARQQAPEFIPGVSGMFGPRITSGHKPIGHHPIGLIERNRWVDVDCRGHLSF
jgi:hypothetical protein